MTKLFMGEIDRKQDSEFTFEANDLKHHMFITGQSGCGKSSVVGRLVEEIVLRDAGHVLFLDCNFEFSRFDEINEGIFAKDYNCKNSPEDVLATFKEAWNSKKTEIKTITTNKINVLYPEIATDLRAQLLGIDQEKHPGTYWLMQLLDEHLELKNLLSSKDALLKLVRDIERWFEGRATRGETQKIGPVIRDICRHMSTLDLTRFANAVNSINKQAYVNFERSIETTVLDKFLVKELFDKLSFLGIDLLNFKYEHHYIRYFIVLHLLLLVWEEAQARFIEWKTDGGEKSPPLYIVIDEAHNLAPSNIDSIQIPLAQGVSRIIRTIAAEGRKFGLFLILISQRPDKIDESVLSECDNFIMMKSIPPMIKKLSEIMPIKMEDTEKLKKASSFTIGQAFYCGAFTEERELVQVDGDIKRTM